MQFQSVVKDLSNSRLNDEEISQKLIEGISYIVDLGNDLDKPYLISFLNRAREILLKTKPENGVMINVLNYLFYDIESADNVRREMENRFASIKDHFSAVKDRIIKGAVKKIRNKSSFIVFGKIELIFNIFKEAKNQGKSFNVNLIGSGQSGKDNFNKLLSNNINVNYYPSSGFNLALENCDFVLIEGFGIHNNSLISNLGINVLAELCEKREIPIYACIDSWKFGHNVKEGSRKSLIMNPKFEEIDLDKLFIISELGIYNGRVYSEQIKSVYPWVTSF